VIRLFVGLALPPDLAARLAALAGGIPGARWVAARNLHLTLRFIGEVTEDVAEDLHHHLHAIHGPAFDLRLDGFGTFGGGKPRALWAGVAAHAELDSLQIRIEQAARDVGLEAETRKFTPHVTLAWLKAAPAERIAAFVAHHSPFVARLPVTGFTLYRSHLGGEGAEYDALAEYYLDY
jgi:RNA 2',3'-cyclic 3'-phosphodiesterase